MLQQYRGPSPGHSAFYQLSDEEGEEEGKGYRLAQVPHFRNNEERHCDADSDQRSAEVGDDAESPVYPWCDSPPAQCLNHNLVGERQSFDERANKYLLVVIACKGRPR